MVVWRGDGVREEMGYLGWMYELYGRCRGTSRFVSCVYVDVKIAFLPFVMAWKLLNEGRCHWRA